MSPEYPASLRDRLVEAKNRVVVAQTGLDAALPLARARQIQAALLEAVEAVEESWSGSCLAGHSDLYFKDFERPPLTKKFSVEWGLLRLPPGWRDRPKREVAARIETASGVSVATLEAAASRAADLARTLSASSLTATEPIRSGGAFNPAPEAIERLATTDIDAEAKAHARVVLKRPMMSRDAAALAAGVRVPPHVDYRSRAAAALKKIEVSRALLEAADNLLAQAIQSFDLQQAPPAPRAERREEGGTRRQATPPPEDGGVGPAEGDPSKAQEAPPNGTLIVVGLLLMGIAYCLRTIQVPDDRADHILTKVLLLLLSLGAGFVGAALPGFIKFENGWVRAGGGAALCIVTYLYAPGFPEPSPAPNTNKPPTQVPEPRPHPTEEQPPPAPVVRPASNSDFEFIVERCSVDTRLDPSLRATVNFSVTPEVNGNPVASKERPYTFDVNELTASDQTPGGSVLPITGSVPVGGTLAFAFGPRGPTFLRHTGISHPERIDPPRYPAGSTLRVGEQALQKVVRIEHPTDPPSWPQVTIQFSVRWTRVSGVTEVSYHKWRPLAAPAGEEGVEWTSDAIRIPEGMGKRPRITLTPLPPLRPEGNFFRPEEPVVLRKASDLDFRIRLATRGEWRLGAENPKHAEQWTRMVKDKGLKILWTIERGD